MDKIQKALQRLSKKELHACLLLMRQIKKDHTKVPNCVALKNKKKFFRVRFGRYRIIFEIKDKKNIVFHRVSKRNKGTYKGL